MKTMDKKDVLGKLQRVENTLHDINTYSVLWESDEDSILVIEANALMEIARSLQGIGSILQRIEEKVCGDE